MSQQIITWNVLHRIHAEKWGSPLPACSEKERVEAIAAQVVGYGADIVCLQEVSGDQLHALRERSSLPVHEMCYPRVPKPRSGPSPLASPEEYLVLLAEGEVIERHVFQDPGKGFLAVRCTSGLVVVSIHLNPFSKSGRSELRHVSSFVARQTGPVLLCGDFNTLLPEVLEALGEGFSSQQSPPESRPSRPIPAVPSLSRTIDHIIVCQGIVQRLEVLDAQDLSDHHPVLAELI